MANYYFRLRDNSANKPTPIILFAQINGNRIKCKTNEVIMPSLWDSENKLPTRIKETKKLTERLTYLLATANDTFLFFRDVLKVSEPGAADYQKKFYELAGINTAIEKTPKTEKKLNLFEFIDKFIFDAHHRQNEITGEKIAINTIKVYRQCRNLLKEFTDTKYKVDFNRLSLDFFLDFKEFLTVKKKFGTNTIGKHIKTLKTFINEANELGYSEIVAHKSKRFKVIQVQTDTIYLTENELSELYKMDLSKKPHMERIRDLFLVGCYTGLRFSDFTNIQPENIKGDFIEITAQKTNDAVVIPIHPIVNEIMNKYAGKYINCLPPAISNQKFNSYIKEICKNVDALNTPVKTKENKSGKPQLLNKVKKYELVSTHTARRSFATNQYNKGISASILMKITGHKTERSFYTYIRQTPKENAERLKELWSKEYAHLKVV
jgi:integrase